MAKDERAQFDATIVGDARGGVRVKIRIGDVLPWAEHPADCAMPCIGYPTMGSAESIQLRTTGRSMSSRTCASRRRHALT